tara:strand:+ start:153 stop:536 length:384 start_codon:yes stop_codon:yes gene_type:complete
MKLLYCDTCRDIVKLYRTTRTCHCGATGGHYKQDGLNAIYYGPAIPLGFANSSFHEAIDSQPEFGMGTNFNAFVIPIVCPTMKHVDLSDYTEVYEDETLSYEDMMERAAVDNNIKKTKIKNVFKNED